MKTPALKSLLIAVEQSVRQQKGRPPIKHRKLWINRQRPLDRQLKQVAERLSRGESLGGLCSLPDPRWDALPWLALAVTEVVHAGQWAEQIADVERRDAKKEVQ